MTRKTEVAPTCPIHNEVKVKLHDKYWCKSCIYGSHLTVQAQKSAVKNWRQSPKGITSEKEYEQGPSKDPGGARYRYLHSDKYKTARKAYNERLKDSLAIARSVRTASAKGITQIETEVPILNGLVSEIREYLDRYQKAPSVKTIIDTAKKDYNTIIDKDKAAELIKAAGVKGKRQKI
jgi:hypothetical protein